ncbi:MAG TPA: hypothetical protein VF773_12925 [Verrucomicrobiae bacterium]
MALALCLATPALAQEEDKKEEKKDSSADKSAAAGAPARGEQSIRSSVSAKVTDIDHEKRQITLKGKEGKEKTLTVDKSVQRFNEIQVGDEVKAEYYASLAGEIRAATPEEKEAPLTDVTLETKADKDSPPAAGAARRVTAVTTVEKLDPATKEVTIKGPRGRTLDIAVKNPDTFEKIKTGDTIVITYTEAVAIALEKQSAKE